MKRRSHHGVGDNYESLTNWKVSNFIAHHLIKGWTIHFYPDTGRIHYSKGSINRIIGVYTIMNTKTGLEYD